MSLNDEARALEAIPMFRDIQPARLKLLAFASARVDFDDGEALFRQGERSDSAFIILAGEAAVELETGAAPVRVGVLATHAVVGEMGVITGRPRSATVRAIGQVEALRISSDVFFDMAREFPSFAIAIMRDLAERLEKTNAQLIARRQG
jgi:CRP-like cAMP-binding protein